MIAVAHITGTVLTGEQRAEAALLIWNQEKGMAFAVILISWLSKVRVLCVFMRCGPNPCRQIYFALLIYSYALHLRKGSYRALARTQPARPTTSIPVLPDEEDEEIEDFYRVPLRQPSTPNQQTSNHLNNNSVSNFANFVGDNQKRTRPSKPPISTAALPHSLNKASVSAPEADEDEVLFDDDYQYASSGSTSKANSKRGTESSTSRSASTDSEDVDAGERTAFVPGRNVGRGRA